MIFLMGTFGIIVFIFFRGLQGIVSSRSPHDLLTSRGSPSSVINMLDITLAPANGIIELSITPRHHIKKQVQVHFASLLGFGFLLPHSAQITVFGIVPNLRLSMSVSWALPSPSSNLFHHPPITLVDSKNSLLPHLHFILRPASRGYHARVSTFCCYSYGKGAECCL